MKSSLLIALLTVLSGDCDAKIIGETNNQGNGKIIITDELCRDNTNRLAYSVMNGYSTIFGCWTYDDEYIHIRWYDNDFRSYPLGGWLIFNANKPNT